MICYSRFVCPACPALGERIPEGFTPFDFVGVLRVAGLLGGTCQVWTIQHSKRGIVLLGKGIHLANGPFAARTGRRCFTRAMRATGSFGC